MTTAYSLNRTIGPTSEPVSLAEARDQCEIISTDTTHDTKLSRFITAAREQLEHDTGYVCVNQTYTLSFDVFPSCDHIDIPLRPLQSVTSIQYQDADNSQQTLDTTVYGTDTARRLVYLKHNQSWPSVTEQHNGVIVTLVAGFGETEANVARLIKQAILLQVTRWFADRGDDTYTSKHDTAYEQIRKRISSSSYL